MEKSVENNEVLYQNDLMLCVSTGGKVKKCTKCFTSVKNIIHCKDWFWRNRVYCKGPCTRNQRIFHRRNTLQSDRRLIY